MTLFQSKPLSGLADTLARPVRNHPLEVKENKDMNARYVQVMDSSTAPDFGAMSDRLLAMIPAALGLCLAIGLIFWLVATIM